MRPPPLPGLIPNENGGYALCPKCVMMWIGIAAGLALMYFLFRKKLEVPANGR